MGLHMTNFPAEKKGEKLRKPPGKRLQRKTRTTDPDSYRGKEEDLERKARCRSRMFATKENCSAACPQTAFGTPVFNLYLITIFVATIP